MSFTAAELDYLGGQRLGRLATVQPDGTLQVSPPRVISFGLRTSDADRTAHELVADTRDVAGPAER